MVKIIGGDDMCAVLKLGRQLTSAVAKDALFKSFLLISTMAASAQGNAILFDAVSDTAFQFNAQVNPRATTLSTASGANAPVLVPTPMPVSGDFDFDGNVDGRDFLLWQRGESPTPLSAGDLTHWRENYGIGPPLTAADLSVPEPSTWVLMSVIASGGNLARQRRVAL
jgi:hypothetical protein